MKSNFSFDALKTIQKLLHWTLLIVPVSIIVGSAVALFLWLLDEVTLLRWQNPTLILLLPLAGVFIVWLYQRWGKNAALGNNLIIDEIHEPGGGIPARMAPLVLVTTIITHLFGGSAGREGTAVQMGGSIAQVFSKWYRLNIADRRILLMCGVSAGFGAVFGTPVAGAIFALEVLAIGSIKYDALMPCLIAAIVAHIACIAYGIQHTTYSIHFISNLTNAFPFLYVDLWLLFKVIIASIGFGLVSRLFAAFTHWISTNSKKYIKRTWLIPVVGGVLVLLISYALSTYDYLGLGVTNPKGGISIVSAFEPGGAETLSWFWKLLLTAITLGCGFKGGEVTPLFFIGATLGNTIAMYSGSPVDLFAGIGFIAVFAGATNTPLACTIMGAELFGADNLLYYAVACFTAYYFSGHSGIYTSQRIAVKKNGR